MISENLLKIKSELPGHVRLIAVSKTHPTESIMEAYQAGQKAFGENRVQELIQKFPELPKDVEWHLIGHLQTNKVKTVISKVALIHSVDSEKLLNMINIEAGKQNIAVNCLLQFHIATEETKYGLDLQEAISLLETFKQNVNQHAIICGVMGMATFTDDVRLIRSEFRTLRSYFDTLKSQYFTDDERFNEISMGMSDDYRIAIEEGSTMVRIGSSIFGERENLKI